MSVIANAEPNVMDCQEPKAISIVVAGDHCKVGAKFIKEAVDSKDCIVVDLRDETGFAATTCVGGRRAWKFPSHSDGDCLQVQLAALTDLRVVDVCQSIVDFIMAMMDDNKVFVLCDTSDAVPDFLAKVLANRVFNMKALPTDRRAYNCNVFSLRGAMADHVNAHVTNQARNWLRNPWTVIDAPIEPAFGTQAAAVSYIAHGALAAIEQNGYHAKNRTVRLTRVATSPVVPSVPAETASPTVAPDDELMAARITPVPPTDPPPQHLVAARSALNSPLMPVAEPAVVAEPVSPASDAPTEPPPGAEPAQEAAPATPATAEPAPIAVPTPVVAPAPPVQPAPIVTGDRIRALLELVEAKQRDAAQRQSPSSAVAQVSPPPRPSSTPGMVEPPVAIEPPTPRPYVESVSAPIVEARPAARPSQTPGQASSAPVVEARPQRLPIGAAPRPASDVDTDGEDDAPFECPFCRGTGRRMHYKKVDNVDAWAAVLENKGVDDNARESWISLYATPGDRGKSEALSIVHGLLKRISGGHPPNSRSAFIVGRVKTAWEKIKEIPDDIRDQAAKRRRQS